MLVIVKKSISLLHCFNELLMVEFASDALLFTLALLHHFFEQFLNLNEHIRSILFVVVSLDMVVSKHRISERKAMEEYLRRTVAVADCRGRLKNTFSDYRTYIFEAHVHISTRHLPSVAVDNWCFFVSFSPILSV